MHVHDCEHVFLLYAGSMDIGVQTLAQLSEENKEKKFISVDLGSKLSGYTKDYLERLCRLEKIEYRLLPNGSFAMELESLLRETHTILLSYEGLTFLERSELIEPEKKQEDPASSVLKEVNTTVAGEFSQENMAQRVPSFAEANSADKTVVSFIGRAVVSDALHPEPKIEEQIAPKQISQPKIVTSAVEISVTPEVTAVKEIKKQEADTAVEIPITKRGFNMDTLRKKSVADITTIAAEKHSAHIPIMAINSPKDEWDSMLLGTYDIDKTETHTASSVHIPIMKDPEVENAVISEIPAAVEPPIVIPIVTEVIIPVTTKEEALVAKQKVTIFSTNTNTNTNTPAVLTVEKKQELTIPTPVAILASAMEARIALIPSSPIASIIPAPTTPPVAKEVQVIPVPSPMLPIKSEEHHLTTHEMHPLMKSAGFNVVFAVMLIASTFGMLSGNILQNIGGQINTVRYVAGVGAVDFTSPTPTPSSATEPIPQKTEQSILPFSNEIATSTGEKLNSLIIRPLFLKGPGRAYEYTLTPEAEIASTSASTVQ